MCAPASALEVVSSVRVLYSADPAVRAAAVKDISAAAGKKQVDAAVAALRAELKCSGAKPSKACSDPGFMRGLILAAGELAKKDSGSPWGLLVWLSSGRTSQDGSFFREEEGDDFREEGYYRDPATAKEMNALLDKVISAAGVVPSCDWPREKIFSLAKKKQDFEGYSLYSYRRNYSGEDIRAEYGIEYSRDWVFRDKKLVYCGKVSVLGGFGEAGVLAVSVEEMLSEELDYQVSARDLATGRDICRYTVIIGPDSDFEAPDSIDAVAANFVKDLFVFKKGGCKSRKRPGYEFAVTPAE